MVLEFWVSMRKVWVPDLDTTQDESRSWIHAVVTNYELIVAAEANACYSYWKQKGNSNS